MSFIVADRVQESSTTTGTGALALGGAYTGYRRFSAAMSTNDTCKYTVEAIDGNGNPSGDWEVGIGTYSALNTLTRTSVETSSNANAAVDFAAGNKRVLLDASAALINSFLKNSNNLSDVSNAGTARTNLGLALGSQAQAWDADLDALAALSGTNTIYYRSAANTWTAVTVSSPLTFSAGALGRAFKGALVKKSVDQTAANYTSSTAVAWDAEEYDTDAFHDNVTNNTRLTVPSGVTRVRVSAAILTGSAAADGWIALAIRKNGATFIGHPTLTVESGVTSPRAALSSAVVTVTAGDYFEIFLQVEADASIDITATSSWFAIEVIE